MCRSGLSYQVQVYLGLHDHHSLQVHTGIEVSYSSPRKPHHYDPFVRCVNVPNYVTRKTRGAWIIGTAGLKYVTISAKKSYSITSQFPRSYLL